MEKLISNYNIEFGEFKNKSEFLKRTIYSLKNILKNIMQAQNMSLFKLVYHFVHHKGFLNYIG